MSRNPYYDSLGGQSVDDVTESLKPNPNNSFASLPNNNIKPKQTNNNNENNNDGNFKPGLTDKQKQFMALKTQESIYRERKVKQSISYQMSHGQMTRKDGLNELKKAYTTRAHLLDRDELETEYETDINNGLTTDQANDKLKQYGNNELTPPKTDPWWLKLLKSIFAGFFNILLWTGSILCFIAYIIDTSDTANLSLGIVLAIVVTSSGVFAYFQESKSADLMGSLSKMKPPNVIIIRDGKKVAFDPTYLVPGDIIELTLGMSIPSDCRIIECTNDMQVDNSSLTGESEPQKRDSKPNNDIPRESPNLCFFGTLIVNGAGKAIVIATGDNTFMGRTAKLASSTDNEETPISKEIKDFVIKISVIAFVLGITFFVVGMFIETPPDIAKNIGFLIGIIVANVPEGLIAIVTVSLTLTAQRMFSKNVKVKNLESVETLGSTSVICSDKTGTLTTNVMTTQHIYYNLKERLCDTSKPYHALKGNFYNNNKREYEFLRLIRCGSLCNNASFIDGKVDVSANATESAMIKFCYGHIKDEYKMNIDEYRQLHKKLHEIPFNSRNKWQLSIHKLNSNMNINDNDSKNDNDGDKHALIVMKGAPERVLNYCDKYIINGEIKALHGDTKKRIMSGVISLGSRGERVLALAQLKLDKKYYNINLKEPTEFEYNYYDDSKSNDVFMDESLSDSQDVIVKYNDKDYQVTIVSRKNTVGDADRSWNNHLLYDIMKSFEKQSKLPIAMQRMMVFGKNGRIYAEQTLGEIGIKPGQILKCIVGPYIFNGTKDEDVNFPFNRHEALYHDDGLVFIGLFAMIDPPRKGKVYLFLDFLIQYHDII